MICRSITHLAPSLACLCGPPPLAAVLINVEQGLDGGRRWWGGRPSAANGRDVDNARPAAGERSGSGGGTAAAAGQADACSQLSACQIALASITRGCRLNSPALASSQPSPAGQAFPGGSLPAFGGRRVSIVRFPIQHAARGRPRRATPERRGGTHSPCAPAAPCPPL